MVRITRLEVHGVKGQGAETFRGALLLRKSASQACENESAQEVHTADLLSDRVAKTFWVEWTKMVNKPVRGTASFIPSHNLDFRYHFSLPFFFNL